MNSTTRKKKKIKEKLTHKNKYRNLINYHGHLFLGFALTVDFQKGYCFSNHATPELIVG